MSLIKQKRDVKKIKKSNKGCWTCKGESSSAECQILQLLKRNVARKIGCDKQLPDCNNCVRTGRSCEGYGIKVQWPETVDGRRPTCSWEARAQKSWNFVKSSTPGELHFLNTTFDDLESRTASSSLRSFRFQPSPTIARGLTVGFGTTDLMPEDKILLSYCKILFRVGRVPSCSIIPDHEVLSRMITTIDDSRNGFRTVLIPRALAGQSLSSQSLREAMLALSAFHLWGHDAAVRHKVRAIRLLSASIGQEKDLANQFATSMMLCICDVSIQIYVVSYFTKTESGIRRR